MVSGDSVVPSETYTSKNVLGSNASTLVPTATVSDGNSGANYQVVPVNASGTITPATLTLTAASNSKTYDGTISAAASPTANGLMSGDSVATSETYASKNVLGSNASTLAPTVIVSDGNGGANYQVVAVNASGTITPATLTLAAASNSKTYDGTVSAAASPTASGLMSGDSAVASETYASKNALGSNASTLVPTATVSDGNGGANYHVVAMSAPGTITQLASVAWIGGASGNWFDPANWAGGAVPDLANVANVIIPTGVTVSFSAVGVSPAKVGPVDLNSIGVGGNLVLAAGALNVGGGGVTLGGLSQSGGSLNSTGAINVGSYSQTGGTTAAAGNFIASSGYNQSGSGLLSVGGNATLAGGSSAILLGNLQTNGSLSVSTTAGPISQAAGTALMITGAAAFAARNAGSPADVSLGNASNSFGAAVSISGAEVSIANAGPLTLGTVVASGNLGVSGNGALNLGTTSVGGRLTATSQAGDITQSGPLTVAGGASVDAGTGAVTLLNAGNNFAGNGSFNGTTVNVAGQQPAAAPVGGSNSTPLITVLTGQVVSGEVAMPNATPATATGGSSSPTSSPTAADASTGAESTSTSDTKTAPNNGVVYRDLNRHAPMVLVNNGIRLP